MKIRQLEIHDDLYDEIETVLKEIPNFSFNALTEEAYEMWLKEYSESKVRK